MRNNNKLNQIVFLFFLLSVVYLLKSCLTLTYFLILSLFSIIIGSIYIRYRTRYAVEKNTFYISIFIFLSFSAILTIWNYYYPPFEIYPNTAYNIMELKGFQFRDTLKLVDEDKDRSLWDDKEGKILLTIDRENSKIYLKDYFEPFFLQDRSVNKDSTIYKLFNYDSTGTFLENNDSIRISFADKIIRIKYEMKKDKDSIDYTDYFISFSNNVNYQRIYFYKTIKYGYSLLDILSFAQYVPFNTSELEVLEGCFFVRQKVNNQHKNKLVSNSKLLFFPGSKLLALNDFQLQYGHTVIDIEHFKQPFNISYKSRKNFYSGIGKKSSDIMYLEKVAIENNVGRLMYLLPKMENFVTDAIKDSTINHFLTSSYDEIAKSTLSGGILYSIFNSSTNHNHANAIINYQLSAASDQPFYFILHDRYNITPHDTVFPNSEFLLTTRNNRDDTKWILNLNDLRVSSPISINDIELSIIYFILLLLIFFLPLYYKDQSPNFITITIYLVVFSFFVVKLFLLWRTSTFVPTKDIDFYTFQFLRKKDYYTNNLRAFYGFLVVSFYLNRTWRSVIIDFLRIIKKNILFYKFLRTTKVLVSKIFILIQQLLSSLKNKILSITLFVKIKKFFSTIYIYLSLKLRFKKNKLFYTTMLVISSILFAKSIFTHRITTIYFPLFIYFLSDYLLFSKLYHEALKNNISLMDRNTHVKVFIKNKYSKLFLLRPAILFSLIVNLLFLFLDPGFLTVFAIFLLGKYFSLIFNFRNLINSYLLSAFLTIFIFSFLGLGKEGISIIFFNIHQINHNILWFIAATYILVIILFFHWRTILSLRMIPAFLPLIFVIFIYPAETVNYINNKVNKEALHIKYRAIIQNAELDKGDLFSDPQNLSSHHHQEILRASHNQWFINLYLFKKNTEEYFKLLPNFNYGASYPIQFTDLIVLRYLIAEHSNMLVYLLILLWIGILYIFHTFSKNRYHEGTFVYLLAVISIFVLLTSTNRFIFFGQDYPLLSINSDFTLLLTFSILLVFLFLNQTINDDFNSQNENHLFSVITLLLIFLLLITTPGMKKDSYENDYKKFDLKSYVDNIEKDIKILNEKFVSFQIDNRRRLIHYEEKRKIDSLLVWFKRDLTPKDTSDFHKSSKAALDRYYKIPVKQDPYELIHLIKNENTYEFAVNTNYYVVKSWDYDLSNWKGNLYASAIPKTSYLINNRSSNKYNVFSNSIEDIIQNSSDLSRISQSNIQIIRFHKGWFLPEYFDTYFIKATKGEYSPAQYKYLLVPENSVAKVDSVFKYLPYIPERLFTNDIISLYANNVSTPTNTPNVELKLVTDENRVLAKNYWLNGKNRIFYPLGKKFLWTYHYVQLIDNFYKNKTNTPDSLRISIDYDLTESIYTYIDSMASSNQLGSSFSKFNISSIDNYGRIRLIVDYKRSDIVPDPNDHIKFYKKLNDLYLYRSNYNSENIMGNMNLLIPIRGIGSSIKPIIYSAVTSQFNYNWNNISLNNSINKDAINSFEVKSGESRDGRDYKIIRYAGKSLQDTSNDTSNVEFAKSDFEISVNDMDRQNNRSYLINSNNFYHSTIIFIGSYSLNQLRNNINTILINSNSINNRIDRFPSLSVGNTSYSFNPDYWPSQSNGSQKYFYTDNSLLALGLYYNYNICTKPEHLGIDTDVKYSVNLESRLLNNLFFDKSNQSLESFSWSFPQVSKFLQIDRYIPNRVGGTIRQGLYQPTVGSHPLKLTPLKITEMTARMITLNSNIKFNLDDDTSDVAYQSFLNDYNSADDYFAFTKDNIIRSLRDVISNPNGTAVSLRELQTRLARFNIYLYAKTGTSNYGIRQGLYDKHLLLIISKTPLENHDLPLSNINHAKFYSVFLTFREVDIVPWDIIKGIINKIVNSNNFRNL